MIELYRPGDRLIIRSGGGDLYAGLILGDFVRKHQMSVEIVDFCISACANYVFLAGETKILNPQALVIFHGGPKQDNFGSLMEQAYAEGVPAGTVFGREGYEAIIATSDSRQRVNVHTVNAQLKCDKDEILNRYGDCELFSPEQRLQYLIYLENELYSRINPLMDKNIPYLGQRGDYRSIYQQYRYFGFFYSLDALRKLNVDNVVVKGEQWHPYTNPLYQSVYEVLVP